MAKRWSALKSSIERLFKDDLDIKIYASVLRVKFKCGCEGIPRYWITLNGETIWDFPKDFDQEALYSSGDHPYHSDLMDIPYIISSYVNIPKKKLVGQKFEGDQFGLGDILKAADSRIGKARLCEIYNNTVHMAAKKTILARLNGSMYNVLVKTGQIK